MQAKMLAAVFRGSGRLDLCERPVPRIKLDTDVLIEIEMASVCGTDVHILSTPPGHPANEDIILGHEYVGSIVDAGDAVSGVERGDRVVVDPNISCGHCAYCARSLPNMCENMTTLGIFIDGGFTQYNLAPESALFKVSRDTPLEQLIFAEPMACVINGIRKLDPQAGESALVLGAGPIGLYFIKMFNMAGLAEIIVSEPGAERARMALECGATEVIDPTQQDVEQAIRAKIGLGVDIAVDAVGSLLQDAMASVRGGGRILLFGMNSKAVAEVRQNDITRGEIDIMGSFIANDTFPATVELLESGRLDLRNLVTHRFALKGIHAAIDAMRSGEAIKVLVDPAG